MEKLKILGGYFVGAFLGFISGIVCLPNRNGSLALFLLFGAVGIVVGVSGAVWLRARKIAQARELKRKKDEAEQFRLRGIAEAEERRAADESEKKKTALEKLLHYSQYCFSRMPKLVNDAETCLKRAQREFSDGAFAPFWDEIETAVNKLAAYNNSVAEVAQSALSYSQTASGLGVPVPTFSLPSGVLPDPRPVEARLRQLVRSAQRNFQFATIYEQRKTNKLLYSGFSTLHSAIGSLEKAISESLDALASSLHASLDDLLVATTSDSDRRGEFEDELLSMQKNQSEMLDKIQHYQRPKG